MADEEEVHSDKEVHIEEDEQTDDKHYDEEVHEDKEMHGDDEKYADNVKDDKEIKNTAKGDKEMANAEKVDNEKSEEEKVDNEQAGDDQADKVEYDQTWFLITAVEESVQANVINEVKNQLPKFLPKAVSKVVNPRIESTVHNVLQKSPVFLAQSSSTPVQPSSRAAEHHDEDQDPPADSDKEKKKMRKGKDTEPSKKSSTSKESSKDDADPKNNKSTWFKQPPRLETPDPEWNKDKIVDDGPEQTWFNDLVNAEKDSLTFDELMATPIDFTKFAINRLKLDKITKADLVRPVYKLLKGTYKNNIELEYNMDQCYNALTDQLDRTNPKGDICPYDLSKPLSLQGSPDVILKLWSPVKVAYDKNAELGISHWDPNVNHSTYYKSTEYQNMTRWVSRLHLNDIKDMLLLHVQNKLFNLPSDDIVDLVNALRMFTQSLVIKKRVEDVQLGGVVYLNSRKQKRLMQADELYKFSDRTLNYVRKILYYRLLNFKLGYNKAMPKRKWTDKDQNRTNIMVKLIDKQLLEKQIMRSLEGLVGGRKVKMDYRLLQRTV
ncbi:hypothetical protein Tco_1166380 [Tanacetum coccineum]